MINQLKLNSYTNKFKMNQVILDITNSITQDKTAPLINKYKNN